MQFVWALFFVGSGSVTPLDTGYRFESHIDCMRAKVAMLPELLPQSYDEFGMLIGREKMSDDEHRALIAETEKILLEYKCIVHK